MEQVVRLLSQGVCKKQQKLRMAQGSVVSEELCVQTLHRAPHTEHTPPPPLPTKADKPAVMPALPAPRRRPRPHPGSSVFREQPRDHPAPQDTTPPPPCPVGGQVPGEFPHGEQRLSQERPRCHLSPTQAGAGGAGVGAQPLCPCHRPLGRPQSRGSYHDLREQRYLQSVAR